MAAAVQENPAVSTNVHSTLPGPEYLQGATLMIDNQDGGILAMVGGRDFKHSEYNRATQAQARRRPGRRSRRSCTRRLTRKEFLRRDCFWIR